jgi:hypothetical protein
MTEALEKRHLKDFLDRLSPLLEGAQAELEVVSEKLGDQVAQLKTGLRSISYDPASDVIFVSVEGHGHAIPRPRRVHLRWKGSSLEQLVVIDDEEQEHLVRFRQPLTIPAHVAR